MADTGLTDDLIAARTRIDKPQKWAKRGGTKGGRLCAVNAVTAVCDFAHHAGDHWALVGALPERRRITVPAMAVAGFNDNPKTTHADIMALFDRAITASRNTEKE